MRKHFIATLTLSLIAAASSQADVLTFGTVLGPEAPTATGSGTATVLFDTTSNILNISTTWAGLSGTTSIAHIHCCIAPPGTVGVAVTPGTLPGFPVGVQAGSYDSPDLDLLDTTTYTANFLNNFGGGTAAGARDALLAGMTNRTAYLNIHTSTFPGGEIRGFLQPVPEPATFAIAGLALTAFISLRRYSSR
jgi:hypothetical protein